MKEEILNIEEDGIKETEFSDLLKTNPIFTLQQFGNYFYAVDPSEIIGYKFVRIIWSIKNSQIDMKPIKCLLRLNE